MGMLHIDSASPSQTSAFGLPRKSLLPLILVLLGAASALLSPPVGAAVVLIGFVWLAFQALPVALAVFVLAAPFPAGFVLHHHHFFLSDAMAVIMALALLFKYQEEGLTGWLRRFFPSAYRWPIVLLLALAVLSLVHAESHSGVVIKFLELVEFFVVIVAVAADNGLDAEKWRPTLFTLFLVAAVLALYGLEQFMLGDGPASFSVYADHVRAYGTFGQPNVFGSFMDQLLPLGIALYLFGPKGRGRGWLLVSIILIGLSVWTSFSRGSWVADIAAIGVMGIVAVMTRGTQVLRPYLGYGILLPIVLFGVVSGLGEIHIANSAFAERFKHYSAAGRLLSITHGASTYDTQQRFIIWRSALKAIRSHLLTGVGMGEFHLWIAQHFPKGLTGGVPPHAHNLYLEWGADLGVLGIVAALWLEWRWMVTSIKTAFGRLGQLDDFFYALSLGAVGTFTAFIVHNWVDYMIDHGVVVPLLLAMGVIAAVVRHHRQKPV